MFPTRRSKYNRQVEHTKGGKKTVACSPQSGKVCCIQNSFNPAGSRSNNHNCKELFIEQHLSGVSLMSGHLGCASQNFRSEPPLRSLSFTLPGRRPALSLMESSREIIFVGYYRAVTGKCGITGGILSGESEREKKLCLVFAFSWFFALLFYQQKYSSGDGWGNHNLDILEMESDIWSSECLCDGMERYC